MFPNLEYIKTLVNGFRSRFEKIETAMQSGFAKAASALNSFAAETTPRLTALWSNRPNWEQNDETALDYVKGRTHWKRLGSPIVILNEDVTITASSGGANGQTSTVLEIDENSEYCVEVDGVPVEVVLIAENELQVSINDYYLSIIGYDTYTSFYSPYDAVYSGTKNFKITATSVEIKQLDQEYIPTHTHAPSDLTSAIPINRGGTGQTTQVKAMAALGQGYATCSTAAATVAKTASLGGFTLVNGAIVGVKFSYANTASSPTLNVASTGTKPIYNFKTNAAVVSGDMGACLHLFMYNGLQWVLLNPLT